MFGTLHVYVSISDHYPFPDNSTCLVILDKFELRLGWEPGQGLVTRVLGAALGPGGLGLTQPLLQVARHLPHAEQVQQLRAQATRHLGGV